MHTYFMWIRSSGNIWRYCCNVTYVNIDIGDEMTFTIKAVANIMDEMEYPGIRVLLDAQMEKMVIPLKIDISTGDVITPHAIEFNYQ